MSTLRAEARVGHVETVVVADDKGVASKQGELDNRAAYFDFSAEGGRVARRGLCRRKFDTVARTVSRVPAFTVGLTFDGDFPCQTEQATLTLELEPVPALEFDGYQSRGDTLAMRLDNAMQTVRRLGNHPGFPQGRNSATSYIPALGAEAHEALVLDRRIFPRR